MKQYSIDVRTLLCCMRNRPEWYVEEKLSLMAPDRCFSFFSSLPKDDLIGIDENKSVSSSDKTDILIRERKVGRKNQLIAKITNESLTMTCTTNFYSIGQWKW